ncbi:hypothetical protein ACPV5R_09245, partial [Vibrio astriarenae]
MIQNHKKTLYSPDEFAMMRPALKQSVGKTCESLVLKVKLYETIKPLGGFPSGQREQTVNLPALPSMVR